MPDDTAPVPQTQTPPRTLAQDLGELTKAVRAAVLSWERASTTMQATQQEMQRTLEQLAGRIEKIEQELAKRRRPDPRLS
jgi:ABC-type transporter Mla subunit MlaD